MHYISSTTKQEQHTEREKEDKKKESQRNKKVRENGHSIREKKRKNNLMRNTYIKKGEWNTKERRNKITKLRTSEGWR